MDNTKLLALINKRWKYSSLSSLFLIVGVCLIGINLAVTLVGRLSALEAERATLQSQISALMLTMDDRERLLAIDRALMKVPAVRANMQADVPEISKKLLDSQNKYYAIGLRTSHILAVIESESGFVPTATSKTKSGKPIAFGLMQLVPTTAKSLLEPMGMTWSPGLMFNPILNIELGTKYLATIHSSMIERGYETVNDFRLTHATYYMGERNVMSYYLEHGTLHPTARDYVVKINMAQQRWAAKGL